MSNKRQNKPPLRATPCAGCWDKDVFRPSAHHFLEVHSLRGRCSGAEKYADRFPDREAEGERGGQKGHPWGATAAR